MNSIPIDLSIILNRIINLFHFWSTQLSAWEIWTKWRRTGFHFYLQILSKWFSLCLCQIILLFLQSYRFSLLAMSIFRYAHPIAKAKGHKRSFKMNKILNFINLCKSHKFSHIRDVQTATIISQYKVGYYTRTHIYFVMWYSTLQYRYTCFSHSFLFFFYQITKISNSFHTFHWYRYTHGTAGCT